MSRNGSFDPANAAKSLARKLAMQALYRWQLNEAPWQDVVNEFSGEEEMQRADREYFRELISGIVVDRARLDAQLAVW
ncbi:MAG TPA: transcription antitermination factor NusB, partial [Steroidobacteraceae bacterium]|nr:transcription antitermination factor NusB [Steroidobacteraceae bacterium]